MKKVLCFPLLMFPMLLMAQETKRLPEHVEVGSEKAVISQEERAKENNWMPMMEESIEILHDGKINQEYEDYAGLIGDVKTIEDLDRLTVSDMYINAATAYLESGKLFVPFVASIEYRKNTFKQGTIDTYGMIKMHFLKGMNSEIELILFSDSSKVEEMGRTIGLIDEYDALFIAQVAYPVLEEYVDKAETTAKILKITGHEKADAVIEDIKESM